MLSGLRWPGQTVIGSWPPACVSEGKCDLFGTEGDTHTISSKTFFAQDLLFFADFAVSPSEPGNLHKNLVDCSPLMSGGSPTCPTKSSELCTGKPMFGCPTQLPQIKAAAPQVVSSSLPFFSNQKMCLDSYKSENAAICTIRISAAPRLEKHDAVLSAAALCGCFQLTI